MKRILLLFILVIVSGNLKAQKTLKVVVQSANGVSNVIGASVYKPHFSTKANVASNEFYIQTTLPITQNIKTLNDDVLGPIIGSPSEGHKVYLKLVKTNKKLKLLDSENESFALKKSDPNYFYILVKAKSLKEAKEQLIYETLADISNT